MWEIREDKGIGSMTKKGEEKGECTQRYESKGPSQRGEQESYVNY